MKSIPICYTTNLETTHQHNSTSCACSANPTQHQIKRSTSMSQYDYLVVGAGLSGAVFANAARRAGKSVLVIDRRDHIAGNVYTEDVEGIQV
ncbi:NAD(P)-binding protein, partial [Collinsella aerofaciens]|uniref:NAD(P)-binding protein n=1 Tax=Collinsella aerofaciens TaxID=74426 RepID=UPI0034A561FF